MSTISPAVQEKFQSLSDDLQQLILEKDVEINTIHDLIRCLEQIADE